MPLARGKLQQMRHDNVAEHASDADPKASARVMQESERTNPVRPEQHSARSRHMAHDHNHDHDHGHGHDNNKTEQDLRKQEQSDKVAAETELRKQEQSDKRG